MSSLEKLKKLNSMLLDEMPEYCAEALNFGGDESSQERLYRSLVNVRPPKKATKEYRELEDEYLKAIAYKKGIVEFSYMPQIEVWQGDITRLKVDAIVNAGNNALLGCFVPCHGCIDNAIHTFAGTELRLECNNIMSSQGHKEGTGLAKITSAYNLPSKYVIHTVGPIVNSALNDGLRSDLENCYKSCLVLAKKHNLKSIAFCCISTGEFRFPNKVAGEIAIEQVKEFIKTSDIKVVFNVFKDEDRIIYEKLLK